MEIIRSYPRPQRRQWQPTPVLLPGKSHGRRSLVGCSPWGPEESDTTEHLHFHCYALEKEMATHSSVLAWRIPGTAEPGGLPSLGSQSQPRLKRLSSSSSSNPRPAKSESLGVRPSHLHVKSLPEDSCAQQSLKPSTLKE